MDIPKNPTTVRQLTKRMIHRFAVGSNQIPGFCMKVDQGNDATLISVDKLALATALFSFCREVGIALPADASPSNIRFDQ